MHKGLMLSLSLYPITYLIDLFEPYVSSLETNILLIFMSCILNAFFYFCKIYFFNPFIVKIYVLSFIIIPSKKKVKTFL